MKDKKLRNIIIAIVVIIWSVLFQYESLRYSFLNPWLGRDLPKFKFLFPPAGWIMFYQVDNTYTYVEVFGVKDKKTQMIDPHDIFRTRTIGFDNIHRNILSVVANRYSAKPFCHYLDYRFPYFDNYFVVMVYYPDLAHAPFKKLHQLAYQCDGL